MDTKCQKCGSSIIIDNNKSLGFCNNCKAVHIFDKDEKEKTLTARLLDESNPINIHIVPNLWIHFLCASVITLFLFRGKLFINGEDCVMIPTLYRNIDGIKHFSTKDFAGVSKFGSIHCIPTKFGKVRFMPSWLSDIKRVKTLVAENKR